MTAPPRRKPAAADTGPLGLPPRPEATGPTLHPAQMPSPGPTQTFILVSDVPHPKGRKTHPVRKAALGASWGLSPPSLSRPSCLFLSCFSPQLGFLGKQQMGFSREAITCLSHLPSRPLPLGASALRLPWQLSKADLLLPVGQRHSTGAAGLALEPVLWTAVGYPRQVLRGR